MRKFGFTYCCVFFWFAVSASVFTTESEPSLNGLITGHESESAGETPLMQVAGGDLEPKPEPLPQPNADTPYEYHIVSQSYALAGGNLSVTVHVGEELFLRKEGEISKRVNLWPLDVTLDVFHEKTDKKLLSALTRALESKQSTVFTVKLSESTPAGFYKIRVQITSQQRKTETFFARFKVESQNKIIVIQTDKSLYKPEQIVLGRAVVLNKDLTGASGSVEIEIRNSQNILMKSYKNLNITSGVAPFKYQIAAKPLLGIYYACAIYEGFVQKQKRCFTFEVDDYVTPKFSCFVTPENKQLPCFGSSSKDQDIRRQVCFKVSAYSTYGQKVKGTLSATAAIASQYACPNSKEIFQNNIFGEKTVCVTVCSSRYRCYDDVSFEANVTDTTGNEIACQGASIQITGTPFYIEIERNNEPFHPCKTLRYDVRTRASLQEEYIGATINFTCKALMKEKGVCGPDYKEIYTATRTTGTNGQATFEFCAPCSALEITCSAKVANGVDGVLPVYSKRAMIYTPERVQIVKSVQFAKIGSKAQFRAFLTNYSKAQVFIMNGKSVLETLSCRPKRISSRIRSLKPDVCDESGIQFRYFCSFYFHVTSAMFPRVTVVVSQRDLSADVFNLAVTPNSKSKLSLKLSRFYAKPGMNVNLKIRAPKGSFVSISAVDRKFYSKPPNNQFLPDTFANSGLDYIIPEFYECGATDHWVCTCESYGCVSKESSSSKKYSYADGEGTRAYNDSKMTAISTPCAGSKCMQSVCRLIGKCRFVSVAGLLKAIGLNILSNYRRKAPFSPLCAKPESPKQYSCCPFSVDAPVPEVETGISSTTSDGGDNNMDQRYRTIYTPTWIWTDIQLQQNVSEHRLVFSVPKWITSWVVGGFAVSDQNAVASAEPVFLQVFKPLLVFLTLPQLATEGERIEAQATVYNFHNSTMTVFVKLEINSDEIIFVEAASDVKETSKRSLAIPAGEARSLTYDLAALKEGQFLVRCTATSWYRKDSVVEALTVVKSAKDK